MINVAEVITGPADLYWKNFLTVAPEPLTPLEPLDPAWLHLGITEDVTNLTIAQAFEKIRGQQVLEDLLSVPTERNFRVESSIMQPTLDMYKMVTNGGTITTGAGFRKLEPIVDAVSTDITYGALIVRGRAGTLLTAGVQPMRDVILRKTATTEDVEAAYGKGAAKVLAVSWDCHYVGPGIAPWAIVDSVA